ncbi:hypothetical protein [Actinoplanes utahensis]|uniref:Uncharacterized protein n=1 Tax=Actinoplanes utahensis TaxID=1869 RepID=A0A0A6UM79_ACTUT|nr:hypothetical protein [Actinoplanes utahensis]KHD76541.1 hypothetical protein MB27_16170 [Actinoplanes utahensis]GIF31218.1 hypothetical protein Aut01nite_42040 [Actinoplanes utahensis]
MKIRLIGTRTECAAAVDRLHAAAGLRITTLAGPYPSHRNLAHVRFYLTCDLLDPATEGAPPT